MNFSKLLFIKSVVFGLVMATSSLTYTCLTKEMLEEHGPIVSNSLDFNYNRNIRAQIAQEKQNQRRNSTNQNYDPEYIALQSITHPYCNSKDLLDK